MAICVTVDAVNKLTATTTPIDSCTSYVAFTSSEYSAMSPIFTPAEVVEISFGVVGVWAIAYGIKVLRRAL